MVESVEIMVQKLMVRSWRLVGLLAGFLILQLLLQGKVITAFHQHLHRQRILSLQMGLGDMLKKAMANDPNLPPATNPGLSKARETVEVEFLPAKKTVKAIPGQKLSVVAQTAGVEIKYKCKKGECKTCTVNFEGRPTKVCVTSLPNTATQKKYTITVPQVPPK